MCISAARGSPQCCPSPGSKAREGPRRMTSCVLRCLFLILDCPSGAQSDFESLPIPTGLRPKAQSCPPSAVASKSASLLRGRCYGGRARHELPWGYGLEKQNPNGVSASVNVRRMVTTPLGLLFCAALTQGCSCLTTLGFIAESRWDSRKMNSSKT